MEQLVEQAISRVSPPQHRISRVSPSQHRTSYSSYTALAWFGLSCFGGMCVGPSWRVRLFCPGGVGGLSWQGGVGELLELVVVVVVVDRSQHGCGRRPDWRRPLLETV